MSNDWMMWAMILQQQAQQAAAARAQAEAEARAKADADAKAAADAEAKRQAQIAQQRQADTAAAQQAEAARQKTLAGLPGPADPYGSYRASIALDNSSTNSTAARTVGGASNPLGGFSSNGQSGLTGMMQNAVAPRAAPGPDFPQAKQGAVTGGTKPINAKSPASIF